MPNAVPSNDLWFRTKNDDASAGLWVNAMAAFLLQNLREEI
jgi:hypothetical protein